MYRFVIILLLSLFSYLGCAPLPCKPPSNYAPDPAAQYTAQEVKVMLKPYLL